MPWDEGIEGLPLNIASSDATIIRVLAGPGTGKSFCLMRRIARLLEGDTPPEKILLITFTRVSAGDLEKELEGLDHHEAVRVRKGTLHSLCLSLLYQTNVLDFTGRIPRALLSFETRFLLEDMGLHGGFGDYYERRRRLKAFEAAWARLYNQEPGWPQDSSDREFQENLDEWLRFHKSILVGEFVPLVLHYLRSNPGCPELNMFDHLLVDEYQDLNRAEQKLIDFISSNGNLIVVGDEDQSIYEYFRYAHPEGISRFNETHDGTVDIPLDTSIRCPSRIIEIANTLILNNLRRTGRELRHRPENLGGDIHLIQWASMQDEAEGIAEFIATKIDSNEFYPGKTLVLCPRRQFGYLIRKILRERGYPAHSFFHEETLDGNPKRSDECKAQEAFTLLNIAVNPDDQVALRCWLGFGSPSLRVNEYNRLREYSSENNCSPRDTLELILNGEASIQYTTRIVQRYHELKQKINEISELSPSEKIDYIFPSDEEWAEPFRPIVEEPPNNMDLSEVFESIRTSIIQPELPRDVEYIRIMSLHKSKGLNADHVIVCGCIEGLLPSRSSDLSFGEKQRYIEEQRRLFYVAITRAKHTLVLSSVLSLPRDLAHRIGAITYGGDKHNGRTIASSFITELGPSCPLPIKGEDWDY